MFIDTHAHLNWDSYKEDYDQMIDRAEQAGLKLIINVGVDILSSQQVAQLKSERIPMCATVGLHPHEGAVLDDQQITDQLEQIEQLALQYKEQVVAIGECGLDFYFQHNDGFKPSALSEEQIKTQQIKLYTAQVNLAKKLSLPLVIHCRDAWDKIFIPELNGVTGIFHTFSGTAEDAQRALDLGFYLSFSCVITYPKNEALRQLLKTLPLEKILTETDCPFLPPQPIRGQRNEPAYVVEATKVIAEMKNLPVEEVAAQIYRNAQQLFKL